MKAERWWRSLNSWSNYIGWGLTPYKLLSTHFFSATMILRKIYLKSCCGHVAMPLLWRHNGRGSVSNDQPASVYSTVHSGADQRKHRSSASVAFVRGSPRWPVNFPHKWPVTRKMFSFDDDTMLYELVNPSNATGLQIISILAIQMTNLITRKCCFVVW